jgi:hypothetical protein
MQDRESDLNRTLIEEVLAAFGRTFPSIRSFSPSIIGSTQMVWNKMFVYPIDSARRQFRHIWFDWT